MRVGGGGGEGGSGIGVPPLWSPAHTLTGADHTGILSMHTVMYPHRIGGALEECTLCTHASNIIKPDGT